MSTSMFAGDTDNVIKRHSIALAIVEDENLKNESTSRGHGLIKQVSLEATFSDDIIPDHTLCDPDTFRDLHSLSSSLDSIEVDLLEMNFSRVVGDSFNNKIVAEHLDISLDTTSRHSQDIMATRVPCLSDIRLSSATSSFCSDSVSLTTLSSRETLIENSTVITPCDTPRDTQRDTSRDVYAMVERTGTAPRRSNDEVSNEKGKTPSPIYSKITRVIQNTDAGSVSPGLYDSLILTEDESNEVVSFINNKISCRISQIHIAEVEDNLVDGEDCVSYQDKTSMYFAF